MCRNISSGKINAGWKPILLNQFHDIISGSSIEAVYKDFDIDYKRVYEDGREIADSAVKSLAENLKTKGTYIYNSKGKT